MTSGLSEWVRTVSTHMPHLSVPQATVLALWSYAIALTRSCGQTIVCTFLAMVLCKKENTVRQQLREFCYEAEAKRGEKRQELDVTICFAPFLLWILSLWSSVHIALALDATYLGTRFVVLAICIVFRGGAIPVGWKVIPAYQKGSWRLHWLELLQRLKPAISDDMTVLVLADRGLYARWLYKGIKKLGWHPFLRINAGAKFRPKGTGRWVWLKELIPNVGDAWRGEGVAFSTPQSRLKCTLLACWAEGCKDPWFILTDLSPQECDTSWYLLRGWVEQGFKCIKRGGWQWNQTRMSDPKRAERLWLAMAVATLWVTSIGGELEVEQINSDKTIDWNNVLPFEVQIRAYRKVRIFRLGWLWLLACLVTSKQLPMPEKLTPEPWPAIPPWSPPLQ